MNFNNLSAIEAKAMYDNKITFIDVREKSENEVVRIPDTQIIPMSEIQDRWNEIPKDKDIVIYCRTGHRSGVLISQLISEGYSNLYNLEGGIVEWNRNKFSIEIG